jgi:hypothetical protein
MSLCLPGLGTCLNLMFLSCFLLWAPWKYPPESLCDHNVNWACTSIGVYWSSPGFTSKVYSPAYWLGSLPRKGPYSRARFPFSWPRLTLYSELYTDPKDPCTFDVRKCIPAQLCLLTLQPQDTIFAGRFWKLAKPLSLYPAGSTCQASDSPEAPHRLGVMGKHLLHLPWDVHSVPNRALPTKFFSNSTLLCLWSEQGSPRHV